jgi:hypothetical protein
MSDIFVMLSVRLSLEEYQILFLAYDGNRNFHTGDSSDDMRLNSPKVSYARCDNICAISADSAVLTIKLSYIVPSSQHCLALFAVRQKVT